MARQLKMTLFDGKDYTFSTLTLREQRAMRNKLEEEKGEHKDFLKKVEDGEEDLSDEEEELLKEIQDNRQDEMLGIVRMSLSRKHEEFKVTDDNTEEDINEKLEDLVDMNILAKVSTFSMTGTLSKELEEEYDIKDIIDLTHNEE